MAHWLILRVNATVSELVTGDAAGNCLEMHPAMRLRRGLYPILLQNQFNPFTSIRRLSALCEGTISVHHAR